MGIKDDWAKTRTHGEHLTEAENREIKAAFITGISIRAIARKLACSSRVVAKHYAKFRALGMVQGKFEPPPKSSLPDRHYKTDFSLNGEGKPNE